MADEAARFTRGGATGPPLRHTHAHGWYWLLLVPLVGVLIPPIYNSADPRLIGIPFFYWYQMAWIPLSVVCTLTVYRKTRGDR